MRGLSRQVVSHGSGLSRPVSLNCSIIKASKTSDVNVTTSCQWTSRGSPWVSHSGPPWPPRIPRLYPPHTPHTGRSPATDRTNGKKHNDEALKENGYTNILPIRVTRNVVTHLVRQFVVYMYIMYSPYWEKSDLRIKVLTYNFSRNGSVTWYFLSIMHTGYFLEFHTPRKILKGNFV